MYYLNADFDYWNMLDWNRPDIDCLHTVDSKSQVIEIRNQKIISGGSAQADATADDDLPENVPLHVHVPQVQLCLCFLLWIPSPSNFFSYLIFLNSSGGIGSLLSILHKYIPDKQIPTNTNHITLLTL